MEILILLPAIAAVIGATAILWGFTTVRFPVIRNGARKVHVACVGDSITYGCTLPLFFLFRYPACLRRRLGRDVQVGAFAVNDRTLQNTGNKPYRKERAFRQSKRFRPDTVVILLGTNDSKRCNWRSPETFKKEYLDLIGEYRSLREGPRVLVCTPPCAFLPVSRPFYLTNDADLDRIPEIAETVRRIAEEDNLELIDLYALTEGRRELFGPDGLHPSVRGAEAIAEEVCRCILRQETEKPAA